MNFDAVAFAVALASSVIAILGLGAAYTGYCGRPIGRLAFVLLNAFSLSLVFSNLAVLLVAGSAVLAIVAWHMAARRHMPTLPDRGYQVA